MPVFREAQYSKHTINAFKDSRHSWSVFNPYRDQPLALRIEALQSIEDYGATDAVTLINFEDLKKLVLPWGHIDSAYDKLYVKLHLPEFPLRLLPPYTYVPDSTFEEFRALLASTYQRWHPAGARER